MASTQAPTVVILQYVRNIWNSCTEMQLSKSDLEIMIFF